MKEAIIHPGPRVEIRDSPIPKPGPHQVLTRIIYSGSNPKDWKAADWYPGSTPQNQGADLSGIVHEVGEGVTEFKKGDRVAAFHEILQPHGSFAEYGLSWDYTTFFLPASTSFQEAAAIPLAGLTAALGLFGQLKLPPPFMPATEPTPLLIYGASSAVGSYAIQFAKRANIHPIICVAGRAQQHVENLIDRSKGDAVIDYRKGNISDSIRAELKGNKLNYAIDAVGNNETIKTICSVMQLNGTIVLSGAGQAEYPKASEGITLSARGVGLIHTEYKDFGYVYSRLITRGLEEGWFKAQPQEVVPGGLGGIEQGLRYLKDGTVSAVKYVFEIKDTEGI